MNQILIDADALIANMNPSSTRLLMIRCAERLINHYIKNIENLELLLKNDLVPANTQEILNTNKSKHDLIVEINNKLAEWK